MRLLAFCCIQLIAVFALAQNKYSVYSEDYEPIVCSGSVSENYLNFALGNINFKESSYTEFQLANSYSHSKLFQSGRVYFGDPISDYINKVADKLLANRPDLRQKLNVHLYQSSSVNALCTGQGVILINIGLIAHLRTEAELAFILAHEITHFEEEHSLQHFNQRKELTNIDKKESSETYENQIDLIYSSSHVNEFAADSMGFVRYLQNSPYNLEAAREALYMLGYSHLPYAQVPFDRLFFNEGQFHVPDSYFKSSVSPISPILTYNDKYHSHPNIYQRMYKLKGLVSNVTDYKEGKDFVLPKSEFEKIREKARFEQVHLQLREKKFGESIYSSFILLDKYPENQFLKVNIAKALYGLSKYKNADEFHQVARSYSQIDGESQQVHYMLRQLTAQELNAIALKYTAKLCKKYPERVFLDDLRKELFKDLIVTNKADFSGTDFVAVGFGQDLLNPEFREEYNLYKQELQNKVKTPRLSYREQLKLQRKKESKPLDLKNKKILFITPNFFLSKINLESMEKAKEEIEFCVNQFMNQSNAEVLSITSRNLLEFLKYRLLLRTMPVNRSLGIPHLLFDNSFDADSFNADLIYYLKIYDSDEYRSELFDLRTGEVLYDRETKYVKSVQKFIKDDLKTLTN